MLCLLNRGVHDLFDGRTERCLSPGSSSDNVKPYSIMRHSAGQALGGGADPQVDLRKVGASVVTKNNSAAELLRRGA